MQEITKELDFLLTEHHHNTNSNLDYSLSLKAQRYIVRILFDIYYFLFGHNFPVHYEVEISSCVCTLPLPLRRIPTMICYWWYFQGT